MTNTTNRDANEVTFADVATYLETASRDVQPEDGDRVVLPSGDDGRIVDVDGRFVEVRVFGGTYTTINIRTYAYRDGAWRKAVR